MKPKKYTITTEVCLFPGHEAYHFVNIPKKESEEIKTKYKGLRRGWGSIPVMVKIGKTSWKSSLFPNKRTGGYLLLLNKKVREAEGVYARDEITLYIMVGDM